jgi:hypothetical protein
MAKKVIKRAKEKAKWVQPGFWEWAKVGAVVGVASLGIITGGIAVSAATQGVGFVPYILGIGSVLGGGAIGTAVSGGLLAGTPAIATGLGVIGGAFATAFSFCTGIGAKIVSYFSRDSQKKINPDPNRIQDGVGPAQPEGEGLLQDLKSVKEQSELTRSIDRKTIVLMPESEELDKSEEVSEGNSIKQQVKSDDKKILSSSAGATKNIRAALLRRNSDSILLSRNKSESSINPQGINVHTTTKPKSSSISVSGKPHSTIENVTNSNVIVAEPTSKSQF